MFTEADGTQKPRWEEHFSCATVISSAFPELRCSRSNQLLFWCIILATENKPPNLPFPSYFPWNLVELPKIRVEARTNLFSRYLIFMVKVSHGCEPTRLGQATLSFKDQDTSRLWLRTAVLKNWNNHIKLIRNTDSNGILSNMIWRTDEIQTQ